MLLSSFDCICAIIVLFIFINTFPFNCCCLIIFICIISIVYQIMAILFGSIIIFIIIIAILITITIIESSILTLYLEAIACFCCGQIPYLPIDFIRDWKFILVVSLFFDRINFLTSSYINVCRKFTEKFKW